MKPVVTRLQAPAHGVVSGVEPVALRPTDASGAINVMTRNGRFENVPGWSMVETCQTVLPVTGLHYWEPNVPTKSERRFVAHGGFLYVDGVKAVMGE